LGDRKGIHSVKKPVAAMPMEKQEKVLEKVLEKSWHFEGLN